MILKWLVDGVFFAWSARVLNKKNGLQSCSFLKKFCAIFHKLCNFPWIVQSDVIRGQLHKIASLNAYVLSLKDHILILILVRDNELCESCVLTIHGCYSSPSKQVFKILTLLTHLSRLSLDYTYPRVWYLCWRIFKSCQQPICNIMGKN